MKNVRQADRGEYLPLTPPTPAPVSAYRAWTETGPGWRHGQVCVCAHVLCVRAHECVYVCVLHSSCISDFGVYINFLAPPTSCNLGSVSPCICLRPRALPSLSPPSAPPPVSISWRISSPMLGTPCFCMSLGAVWGEGETFSHQGA